MTHLVSSLKLFSSQPLKILCVTLTLIIIIPLLSLFLYFFDGSTMIHLKPSLFVSVTLRTCLIGLSVVALSFVIGIGFAWLTTCFEFPGQRFFSWLLLLPMAIPHYVYAFVMIGLFDFSGPIQQLSHHLFGLYLLPSFRHSGGLVLVLSFSLYPYMYLFARQAFMTQGQDNMDVCQSLGYSRWHSFLKFLLPASKPWIGAACIIILMEVLADFGAASIFNITTFTPLIYQLWFGYFSLPDAARLSCLLVVIGLLLIFFEKRFRHNMRFSQNFAKTPLQPSRLQGSHGFLASFICSVFFSITVLLPLTQLVSWSFSAFFQTNFQTNFLTFYQTYFLTFFKTILIGLIAGVVIVLLALVFSFSHRLYNSRLTHYLTTFSTLGYALPGTVLAVALFSCTSFIDHHFLSPSFLLSQSLIVMFLAYLLRFMMPAFRCLSAAFERICNQTDEMAQQLGASSFRLFRKIHFPLIRPGIYMAFLIVCIEVIKELPITLMTRPFGWDTLAVRIYNFTAEGLWAEAAFPSLLLIMISLIPVLLLMKPSHHISTTYLNKHESLNRLSVSHDCKPKLPTRTMS